MAIKKYVRCPVCGSTKPIKAFSRDYVLEILYNNFGGRGKSKWYPSPDGGIKALKSLFIQILEDIVAKLKELDGCDYCAECGECECNIDTKCPDKVRGLSLRELKNKRKEIVIAMKESGKDLEEIARELKISTRTVRRDQGGK
jgi:hypothetical protein